MALNDSQRQGDTAPDNASSSPLAALSGSLLIAAALFAMAAIVGFGTAGMKAPWGWGFAVLAGLALAGSIVGRGKGEARDRFGRQRVLIGSNAFISLVLFALLLVGVNYLATRRHHTFDLTSNRVNSLSDQTRAVLGKFKTPVEMTYIYQDNPLQPGIDPSHTALLRTFSNSSDNVKVRYLNADEKRTEAKSLNLSPSAKAPLLLIQVGGDKGSAAGHRQEVAVVDEQNITSALIKLSESKTQTVYFLTGHGEISPTGSGDPSDSISQAAGALESQNYVLKTFSLSGKAPSIPSDAAAVIVLRPRADLLDTEEKVLKQYASGNGRLLLFLTPTPQPLPHFGAVLKSLGVEQVSGVLVDARQSWRSVELPVGVIDDVNRHPILRGVVGGVVFPGCVPLRKGSGAPSDLNITSLFDSSSESAAQPMTPGQKSVPGPFSLALAVEKSGGAPGAAPTSGNGLRAVVAGCGDFVSEGSVRALGNLNFFQASVNWVVGSDTLVTIPPKEPVTNTLMLTGRSQSFVGFMVLFFIPALVLLVGAVVWWRRR